MTTQIKSHSLGRISKINWKAFGPGILMASAAIGASHLVSSTQAGALFGWQLAIVIILANVLKYPFFRFGIDYVYDTGDSLIAGYAKKSKVYLWVYFILSVISSIITLAAVGLMSAVILTFMFPSLGLTPLTASVVVMVVSWVLLIAGRYNVLDGITKIIILALAITTVAAVFIAAGKPTVMAADFVEPSPWNLASLSFIVVVVGWMPAPLEFSVITSMWTAKKIQTDHTTHEQGRLDFNVGFATSTILAVLFLALGVYVQYGSGQEIQTTGSAYVGQLIDMYTATIGEWSRLLVAFIAFMCMFSTTLTSGDGYGRANAECWRLIKGEHEISRGQLIFWISWAVFGGFIVIAFFTGQLGNMLKFAMSSAFVSAPVFAWLNYSLVRSEQKLSSGIQALSIIGFMFLLGFALLYVANTMGVFG